MWHTGSVYVALGDELLELLPILLFSELVVVLFVGRLGYVELVAVKVDAAETDCPLSCGRHDKFQLPTHLLAHSTILTCAVSHFCIEIVVVVLILVNVCNILIFEGEQKKANIYIKRSIWSMDHVNHQQLLINKCRAIKSSIDRLIVTLQIIDRDAINSAKFQKCTYFFTCKQLINIHFIRIFFPAFALKDTQQKRFKVYCCCSKLNSFDEVNSR